MTKEQMMVHLTDGPVPHRINPDGKLQVLDLTSLPGAWKELFDDQGFFVGGPEPVSVPAEEGEVGETGASHSVAETEDEEAEKEESQAEDTAKPLQGKLPEGFPALAALNAAGIHTYAQLRNAGELTEIPGIGVATALKIEEALKG